MRAQALLASLVVLSSISLGCSKDRALRVSSALGWTTSAKPLAHDGAGSTIVLAAVGPRRIGFAADEDDARVHAFDLDSRVELSASPLPGTPAQIVMARDGSLFVAIRDRARVARYRVSDGSGALELVSELHTAPEPIGLALADDDATLLVATGWGAELDVFDIEKKKLRTRVPLSREPRAVIATKDGRAFVAHAVDSPLSMVSFDSATPNVTTIDDATTTSPGQGFALASYDGKIFAPRVTADPEAPATYYGGPTMTPYVAVIGETEAPPPAPPKPDHATIATDDMGRPLEPVAMPAFRSIKTRRGPPIVHCLLPRAAAVRRAPEPRLLVACMGDDVLIEYLTDKPMPMSIAMKKRPLPGGVTGLAIDGATDTAVAWAQHSRKLVFVRLTDDAETRVAASGATRLTPEEQEGRRIFHAASDHRLSADGRACASCHPDGRDDGRVWKTPDGPRQTMMLAGRLADTAPYGWSRQSGTLQEYFADTISRLQGKGLSPRDATALESYLLSLKVPAGNVRHEATFVAQGKAIFESKEAACSSCHAGAATTDGARHDVGTGSNGINELETPSLRFIAKTAPYFHDGRYPTQKALLVANDNKMGSTRHLHAAEIDALAAYLESL